MDMKFKTHENRIRRMADRAGYRLQKSRSRDERAMDFGLYALFEQQNNIPVNPPLLNRWTCSWKLDEVEEFLTRET
jgi:hypothetical protein